MSKRRHRHKAEEMHQNSQNRNQNNPFGINPSQIMNLLGGNMDMSQIGNVLSSMNKDGFDFGNLNLGPLQNMMSGKQGTDNNQGKFDLGMFQNMMGNMGLNDKGNINASNNLKEEHTKNTKGVHGKYNKNETLDIDEFNENIQMLRAVQSIVDEKKSRFIDTVIEAYSEGSFK